MKNTSVDGAPRVTGVIAEYNPLHNGHLFQLEGLKRAGHEDRVVCVLSCAFTQRGDLALLSSHARAECALRAGADVVLGMPFIFGTAPAERFAMGGVGILNALGVVTHLSFGVEERLLPALNRADEAISENPAFDALVKAAMASGLSYAGAHGEALAAVLKEKDGEGFNAPNFNLALCYLKALRALESGIRPLPVERRGDYHASAVGDGFPSAAALRTAYFSGDWEALARSMPSAAFDVLKREAAAGRVCRPDALDKALLCALSQMPSERAARAPGMSEGLHNRVLAAAPFASSREDLIARVKTRRYPYTRISRALAHLLAGSDLAFEKETPAYARLLGFRRGALPLLAAVGKSGFPLVSRPARSTEPMTALDMHTEQLWYIGAGLEAAEAYRRQVITI